MTKKTNTQKKHDRVRMEFKKWNGKRKYSYTYIIEQLSEEFCLSERTIQDILAKEN